MPTDAQIPPDAPSGAKRPDYTCSMCHGTFEMGWDDEDAHAEAKELFGRDGHASEMAIVCDDCFNKLNGAFHFKDEQ